MNLRKIVITIAALTTVSFASAAYARNNVLFATIHTSTGLTARVIASAQEQFQGFIDAAEQAGYRIHNIGCLSRGHMRNSKHHWGGACDFDQRRRNITAGFMYHITAIAHRFGLVDGCEWHYRDCGHIEVAGSNTPYHNHKFEVALREDHSRHHHTTRQFSARRHYKHHHTQTQMAFVVPDRLMIH